MYAVHRAAVRQSGENITYVGRPLQERVQIQGIQGRAGDSAIRGAMACVDSSGGKAYRHRAGVHERGQRYALGLYAAGRLREGCQA